MSKLYRGEMQDNLGNTIYPHTEAGLVFCADGETVQQKIAGTAETLNGITGVSDSTELDDSTKLATSKAVKTLKDSVYSSLKGFEPILDETGKITGYKTEIGGADTVFPFSSGCNIITTLTHGQNQALTYTFTDDYESVILATANVDDAGNHAPSVKVSSGTISRLAYSYRQNISRYLNFAVYKLSNIQKGSTLTVTTGGYLGVSYIVG